MFLPGPLCGTIGHSFQCNLHSSPSLIVTISFDSPIGTLLHPAPKLGCCHLGLTPLPTEAKSCHVNPSVPDTTHHAQHHLTPPTWHLGFWMTAHNFPLPDLPTLQTHKTTCNFLKQRSDPSSSPKNTVMTSQVQNANPSFLESPHKLLVPTPPERQGEELSPCRESMTIIIL